MNENKATRTPPSTSSVAPRANREILEGSRARIGSPAQERTAGRRAGNP